MKRPRRSANEVKAEKEAIADAKKAETAKRKAGIKRIADFQKHLRQQEEEASSAHLHREESPKVAAGMSVLSQHYISPCIIIVRSENYL